MELTVIHGVGTAVAVVVDIAVEVVIVRKRRTSKGKPNIGIQLLGKPNTFKPSKCKLLIGKLNIV